MQETGAMAVAVCGCERPRRTAADYMLNPCRRVATVPARAGEVVAAADGPFVQFAAWLDGERVRRARYRAASCATLVAYAEALAEMVEGRTVRDAMPVSAVELIAAVPGVPKHRQDRAALAVRAWWSAVAWALDGEQEEGTA